MKTPGVRLPKELIDWVHRIDQQRRKRKQKPSPLKGTKVTMTPEQIVQQLEAKRYPKALKCGCPVCGGILYFDIEHQCPGVLPAPVLPWPGDPTNRSIMAHEANDQAVADEFMHSPSSLWIITATRIVERESFMKQWKAAKVEAKAKTKANGVTSSQPLNPS